MRQLHPVFNVVKLSTAPEDLILGRKPQAPLLPIIVDREEEWEVEEILNSRWHWRRFQFLVQWKGFSREHNSWEVASDIKAPDLIAEHYRKHPAAPRHICWTDFDILFKPSVTPLENFRWKCNMGYTLYPWISLLKSTLETSYKPQT